jgi:hypothetical protein
MTYPKLRAKQSTMHFEPSLRPTTEVTGTPATASAAEGRRRIAHCLHSIEREL